MLFSLSVGAEENAMQFMTTDGVTHKISSTGLEIKFADGNLVATNSTESLTLSLSQLESMQFESFTSAIASHQEMQGAVRVTNMNGVAFGTYNNILDAEKNLSAGVYVAKFENGKSVKFIVNK